MKKNLFKLLFVMLFLLTVSFTFVYNNNTNVLADETETEEVVEPSLNIYKKNISYASEIYIMYAVSYEGIDVTTNPVKMLFYNSVQDEYTTQTASYVASSEGSVNIGGVSCQIFASNGLAAKQMTDDIYARAYVEINDEIIYSEVVKYSVLEYYYEIKEAGTVSTNILNLLEAMVNYGSAAQINFNYNTEKLANATYYKVSVENGTLEDGFVSGRYQKGDLITLTADTPLDGMKFLYWLDEAENIVSTSETLELEVESSNTYTAVYTEITIIKEVENFSMDIQYNTALTQEDLPNTVVVNNDTDFEEQVDVVWDLTTYNSTQIGAQVVYGTLVNTDYVLETPIKLTINVSSYTFDYDEISKEYSISKYYGTDDELTIPSKFNNIPVVSIKANAFENASTIKTLIIPSTIETIELAALSGCTSIESITVPFIGESLYSTASFGYIFGATSYAYNSTYVPQTLKEVNILEGIIETYDFAFYNCSYIISIELPESIKHINRCTFYNCKSLLNITIPEGVTTIGSEAFNSCNVLTSITIPKGVTSIGSRVFSSCYSLTTINIPKGVTSIGTHAFSNCSNLTSIEIPESITSIGAYAFSNCRNLTSIEIPDSVTIIGEYAFSNCRNLLSIELSHGISSIKRGMFYNCSSLVSIKIPESVTNIEAESFSGCSNLTSIEIPESVTKIGWSVFYSCSNLTSVKIPKGVTSIESGTFMSCYGLINLEIPNGVTSIGAQAFDGCISLLSIDIPNSVASIGQRAFEDCTSLVNATISEGVTSIGSEAFYGCSSLTNITIPEGVTSIGGYAFYNCSSLISIILPNSVTNIGKGLFKGCSNLTSVELPNSITGITKELFYNCSRLISIEIPEGVTSIGEYAFSGCSRLTSLVIPNSVVIIDNHAFSECTSLKTIYNLSDLEFTIGSTEYGYVAYYAEVIYTMLPEKE